MPKRIQLKRTKGWRKPAGAIVVARPTKWGNPFRQKTSDYLTPTFSVRLSPFSSDGLFETTAAAVEMYRFWLRHSPQAEPLRKALSELRGHDLCCFCPLDQPCHADVLLDLANNPGESPQACRVCGCTEDAACLDEDGEPCWWVATDLCSHCVTAFAS